MNIVKQNIIRKTVRKYNNKTCKGNTFVSFEQFNTVILSYGSHKGSKTLKSYR